MFYINKTLSASAVDYAAEELKKYLRMMMPEGGDVKIAYNPEAEDGFRLGLMQDFGLDVSDAEDVELDDILYIDTDECGGIIAGSNPRSVLLAVYEYFRQMGARWLFPGVDGEYIPMKDITPVKYRHKPSMRYRGFCNEGAEYQGCMLDAIDFIPKVGMNVFMLEFFIPRVYYEWYYKHYQNQENRPPEPVTEMQILQWKRECEVEIAKRGLQFHDIGHGFTMEAFGINTSWRGNDGVDHNEQLTEEQRSIVALVGGERKLNKNIPNWTNFCMSNEAAQKQFAKFVADYAASHSNSDYLHIWLADGSNNHCECEECQKKIPSDWYMQILNLVDEELTARELDTRIVFIVYVDTSWAPRCEMIKNQDRFTLMLAPITRSYTKTLSEEKRNIELRPYERNKLKMPADLDEYLAYFEDWQASGWRGSNISYEYHFWRHQYFDISGIKISKLINDDVKAYLDKNINGIIEDGSQRSFFPTGLAFYTYARSMYDVNLTADDIAEEYFSAAFGEDWKKFYDYLIELEDAMKYRFCQGEMSENKEASPFYSPTEAKNIAKVPEIVSRGRELIREHYNSDYRVRTVSVRLLEHHADFAEMHAAALYEKALGNDERALELGKNFRIEFGRRECEIQRYFDQYECFMYLNHMIYKSTTKKEAITV